MRAYRTLIVSRITLRKNIFLERLLRISLTTLLLYLLDYVPSLSNIVSTVNYVQASGEILYNRKYIITVEKKIK